MTRLGGWPVRLCAEGVWWADDSGAGADSPAADGLVLADRRRPERPLGMEYVEGEVVRVGDAREPRDLSTAIAEGREAVEAFTVAGPGADGHQLIEEIKEMSWIEVTTVGDLVRRGAVRHTGGGVVFPTERATIREVDALADRFARGLLGLGVQRGEHVGILLPQRMDYVGAFIGAARIGAMPVPINARFKDTELRHVIPHAEMVVLFVSGGGEEVIDYAGYVADISPPRRCSGTPSTSARPRRRSSTGRLSSAARRSTRTR